MKVASAWEPLARVFQAFAAFEMTLLPSLLAMQGPFVVITGPFIAVGLLLNVVPYVAVEVMLNCDLGEQVKRQAKMCRENLDLVASSGSVLPIPGMSEVKQAIAMVRPFLVAAEAGLMPAAGDVTKLAAAAGVLDGVGADQLGTLEALVEGCGLHLPEPPDTSPWLAVAGAAGAAAIVGANRQALSKMLQGYPMMMPAAAADAAAARQYPMPSLPAADAATAKAEAFAIAKAKAKAEMEAKARANAEARKAEAKATAKAKAKAEMEAKARANAAAGMHPDAAVHAAVVDTASAAASSSIPWLPLAVVGGGAAFLFLRRKRK
jgi:hypothetical protein